MTLSMVLAIAACALQVGDWLTTRRVLAAGGRELNPVLAWLIARLGVDGALVPLKVAVGAMLLWVATLPGLLVTMALGFVVLAYAWVVVRNWGEAE